MTEFLYSIDVAIFYFINNTISNPLFDKFFPFITEVKNWYLVYTIFWLILVVKGGRTGRIAAIGVLLLITFSDQISSSFFKNLFERIRPCNVLPDVRILAGCTGSFSFPSSHAVNNFAFAVFFSKIYPKFKISFYLIAVLASISRPYVGVHYPSDILGGALIGALIGFLFAILVQFADNKFPQIKFFKKNEN